MAQGKVVAVGPVHPVGSLDLARCVEFDLGPRGLLLGKVDAPGGDGGAVEGDNTDARRRVGRGSVEREEVGQGLHECRHLRVDVLDR